MPTSPKQTWKIKSRCWTKSSPPLALIRVCLSATTPAEVQFCCLRPPWICNSGAHYSTHTHTHTHTWFKSKVETPLWAVQIYTLSRRLQTSPPWGAHTLLKDHFTNLYKSKLFTTSTFFSLYFQAAFLFIYLFIYIGVTKNARIWELTGVR